MEATAKAHANIALVKYWGKRDERLNLPETGSLSLTLDGLTTTTTVRWGQERDVLWIDGRQASEGELQKVLPILQAVRQRARSDDGAYIESYNDFPTAAGLASSASGMAALTVAASKAAGLSLSDAEHSRLARLGSGSACRSIYGGFVRWNAGAQKDGSDSHAVPLFGPEHWDLQVIVAVVSRRRKPTGSTDGMRHTRDTSPYHPAWVNAVREDLHAAEQAIKVRDLHALQRVTERSCLRMHADMLAADPPLIYLQPESWRVIQEVYRLRNEGARLFFTADAGPNIKLFCAATGVPEVRRCIDALPDVVETHLAIPGSGAHLVPAQSQQAATSAD